MSRRAGAAAVAHLAHLARPTALAADERDRRARVEAPEPPADSQAGAWYHVGPVRNATRAEVVGPDPADPEAPEDPEGEPAPDPAPDPAETATTADVYLFDSIGGWWGVSADDFVRDVAGLDVERIVLHLNSPGGDVWDGVAIANMLRQHRAEVVVRVDGLAASAASVVAMAGDVIVMGVGSTMMVHDAWTWAVGNPAELRHEADVLDTLSNGIAETYAARAGGTRDAWRAIMAAEGWYTASEAVEAKLADRVADASDAATSTGAQVVPGQRVSDSYWWDAWDTLGAPERHSARLSAYRHAGRAEAPTPAIPSQQAGPTPPAAAAPGSTPTPRGGSAVELTDEQVPQVRTQLGLPETADRAAVQAALDQRLTGAAPAAASVGPDVPEGFVLVERSTFDTVQARAERGDQARTHQERQAREATVEAAIRDGRIAPAARASWLQQLTPAGDGAVATSMAATLAQLPKGAIPVDSATGYTGSGETPSARTTLSEVHQDPTYQSWKV